MYGSQTRKSVGPSTSLRDNLRIWRLFGSRTAGLQLGLGCGLGIGKWGGYAYVTCGRHNFRSPRWCYMSVRRGLGKILVFERSPTPFESHPAARLSRKPCPRCVSALYNPRLYLPVTLDLAQQRLLRRGCGCSCDGVRVTVAAICSSGCAGKCLLFSGGGAACYVWAS